MVSQSSRIHHRHSGRSVPRRTQAHSFLPQPPQRQTVHAILQAALQFVQIKSQ